jgi:hypothetical protein
MRCGATEPGHKRRPMSVVPGVRYACRPHTHNLCNARNATSLLAREMVDAAIQTGMRAKLIQALRLASVLLEGYSTIVELRSNRRLARRKGGINQTLRFSSTILNHQNRIAPTTTTNRRAK